MDEITGRIERLELPFDARGVDDFGVSKWHLGVAFRGLRLLYKNYFHVRSEGVEHIPPRGRAMLVGNHSGGGPGRHDGHRLLLLRNGPAAVCARNGGEVHQPRAVCWHVVVALWTVHRAAGARAAAPRGQPAAARLSRGRARDGQAVARALVTG